MWTRRAGAVALVVSVVALGAASSGSGKDTANTEASADQTFTDPSNDSTGRLDIRTVRVTSSGDRLDIRVNLAQKTIGTTEHVGITLDFDGDGRRDMRFFFDGTAGGTLEHIRYPSPGTFEKTPASIGTFSNNDFGITFNLRLPALGNPAKFNFDAFAKERDEPAVWDWAPSSTEYWSFVVQEPPGPSNPPGGGGGGGSARDFVARDTTIFPRRPEAGSTVFVSTRFVFRSSGQLVRAGRLACRGTAGSRNVVGRPYTTNRDHFCAFDLPRSSGGTTFSGRVILSLTGRTRTAQRSARITPASALRLSGPSTNGEPRADHQFAASFLVELVRPGTSSKQINDGLVTCRATVGGRALSDSFNGFDAARRGKLAVCTWDIPASAKGSTFLATVTVTVRSGLTATKTFSRRVR